MAKDLPNAQGNYCSAIARERDTEMIGVLGATTFILYIMVAVLLLWKYRGTRDAGFLWLGLPLVLLPVIALPIALWLEAGVDRLALGQQINVFPFTLVERGQITLGSLLTVLNLMEHVVWGILSLVAILAIRPHRPQNWSGKVN